MKPFSIFPQSSTLRSLSALMFLVLALGSIASPVPQTSSPDEAPVLQKASPSLEPNSPLERRNNPKTEVKMSVTVINVSYRPINNVCFRIGANKWMQLARSDSESQHTYGLTYVPNGLTYVPDGLTFGSPNGQSFIHATVLDHFEEGGDTEIIGTTSAVVSPDHFWAEINAASHATLSAFINGVVAKLSSSEIRFSQSVQERDNFNRLLDQLHGQ
ncbi:hypothetical protein C8R42DRAFT_289576 [Lentinula raphanica]|nr:hypothetical protein C8R42DRAFT_289576 [Lentinula raphanica]